MASACGPLSKTKDTDDSPTASSTAITSPKTSTEADKADGDTVRLSPDAFPELPSSIREELKRRGCTIPQVYFPRDPSNVVRGHFTTSTLMDIAVLCSRNRVSSILVFRNGSASDSSELASAPDSNYLQDVGGGQIGYSRYLGVADSAYIQQHFEAHGEPKPPTIDHEGINDFFVEKASTIWYWRDGKWVQLTGAD